MTQLLTSDSYIPTTSGAITLPSITNNGDGSVTVGTGVFYLHDAYPGESHVNKYTVSGATFTLVDGSNNYIYVDYNAGSPVLKQTTDRASFVYTTTATPVYTIYRNGTALTILDWDTAGTALPEKLLLRTINNKRFERDETIGGLILADSGSLHFTISAGTIWYGVNDQALTAVDSAVDTVKRYLWNGTAWTSSAVTTFENTYYQGPSGLVAVSTARYCITWVYRSVQSGKVAYTLLGTADYKLAEAQAAPAPSNVPPEISSTCVLVGRIIVAKSATTATEVDSAFITPFASAGGTGTTNHNDLAGRDATGCHPASSITNTPAGNIAATTVQAALNELDTEKAALSGATFTGGVSAPSFDSATLNLGTSTATQINLGTASTTQTVNIGTGSGTTTINLGGAGDTVNISGTLAYVNVTNMTVTDKLITLNKGGGASTGFSSGFEIEENAVITGYCRSTSDNTAWEIKTPGSAGVATLSPGASNVSVWHSGNLTNLNQLSNGPGYITSSGSCAYATTAGSAPANGGTATNLSGGSVNATSGVFLGAGASADPYGRLSVCMADDSNSYSYLGLTRNGQVGIGIGIDISNKLWIGSSSGGVRNGGNWLSLTSGGVLSATQFNGSGAGLTGTASSLSVNYAATAGSAPASDVYAWAKAANKPSYNFSEIGSEAISATTGSFSGAVSATSFSGSGAGLTGTASSLSVNYAATAGSASSASNSNTVGGYSPLQLNALQSQRDFTNGTLIQTSLDYSVSNGSPWLLEITGNSYGGGLPIDSSFQGYIYNDTIINMSGKQDGFVITGIVAFNYSGKLCFWFPRQSYWQGFTVFVSKSDASNTIRVNYVSSISDSAKPSGITKEVTLPYATPVNSSNISSQSVNYANSAGAAPWSGITGKPTTLSGYGITDSVIVTGANADIKAQYTLINGITWQGSWNGIPSASNPTYVWGNNGLSGTQQLFNTANLSVNYATTAGEVSWLNHATQNPDTKGLIGIHYALGGSSPSVSGSADGALINMAYPGDPTSWGSQIFQDYRTGRLVVRGLNNTNWTPWLTVIDSSIIGSQSVNYANSAGGLKTASVIEGGTGWSYLTINASGGSWDIAQCNANGNVLEFRPDGGDAGRVVMYRDGTLSASQFNGSGAGLTGTASSLTVGTATNLNGGTVNATSVSATTGSFSGVLTAPTAAAGTNTNQVATTAFVKAAIAAAGGSVTNNATTVTGTECTSKKMIHSGTAIVYGVIVTNTTNSARYFKLFSDTNIDDNRLFLKVEVPAGQTVSLFPTGGIPDTAGGYSGIYAFCTTGSSDTDTTYASSGDMFATILWA